MTWTFYHHSSEKSKVFFVIFCIFNVAENAFFCQGKRMKTCKSLPDKELFHDV